jgi:beta-barrel assembly-enhancing protease
MNFPRQCGLAGVMVAAATLVLTACENIPKGVTATMPSSVRTTADKVASVAKSAGEASREFSEAEEIALGEQLMSAILGVAPLHPDERLQRYVNQVGRWIASQSERPNLPWRFAVLNSPQVNAGAAPGGQIYITTGLLFRMRSESELAGALAHEIAHVVQRHHLTAYRSKQLGAAFVTGAGAVADAKLRTGELGKSVVKLGINEAQSMIVLSLGRSEEEQADRMGMVLAARAGYDPYGLPATIQILQDMAGAQSGTSLLYATHPSPEDRLAALDRAFGTTMEVHARQGVQRERFMQVVLAAAGGASSTPASSSASTPKAAPPAPRPKKP